MAPVSQQLDLCGAEALAGQAARGMFDQPDNRIDVDVDTEVDMVIYTYHTCIGI